MTATLFSVDPNPPQKGNHLKICFDFSTGATTLASVLVTFDLQGGGEEIDEFTLHPREPCRTIWVPDNATWYTCEETTSVCDDLTGAVA